MQQMKPTNIFARTKYFLQKEKYFVLVVLLLFGLIYVLNILYPLYVDDWDYSFTTSGKRVGSFMDILSTQYDHYFEWGGRTVVHIIAQSLLWFGEGWGDILNSVAYVALILVMYCIANRNKEKHSVSLFIFISLCMWFLQSSFSETVLWITGSANYLWGCMITLFFLLPYCSYYYKPDEKENPVKTVLFFVLGVLAGWTNENMALALVFFVSVLLFMMRKEKKKIPVWAIIGFAGLIVGAIFLFVAPGNYVRLNLSLNGQDNDFWYYFDKAISVLHKFLRFGSISVFIFLLIAFVYVKYGKGKIQSAVFRLSFLFFSTAIIGIIVMFGSPSFPPRAWFGVITYLIVAIAVLYADFDFSIRNLRIINLVGLSLIAVLFCISYTLGMKELNKIHNIFVNREAEIERQKAKGIEDIVLYGKFERKRGILIIVPKMVDLPDDLSDWRYTFYAKYHGVRSIALLDNNKQKESDE